MKSNMSDFTIQNPLGRGNFSFVFKVKSRKFKDFYVSFLCIGNENYRKRKKRYLKI